MIAIVTLLTAFPLGYLVRSRLAAHLTYAVAYLWCFTFQSVYLLLDALSASPDPMAFVTTEFPWSYGVVTALILVVGIGLVEVGRWVAAHRTARGTMSRPGRVAA